MGEGAIVQRNLKFHEPRRPTGTDFQPDFWLGQELPMWTCQGGANYIHFPDMREREDTLSCDQMHACMHSHNAPPPPLARQVT